MGISLTLPRFLEPDFDKEYSIKYINVHEIPEVYDLRVKYAPTNKMFGSLLVFICFVFFFSF